MSGNDRPLQIVIINPNTSDHITDMMVRAASQIAGAHAQIRGVTAPFGSPSLESPAELAIAAHAVLEALAAHVDCDATIIGAFGDPGLEAAQHIAPMPVFGLGQCGLQAAGANGRRFAIVTVGTSMQGGIERAVRDAGLHKSLAALHFVRGSVLELAGDRRAYLDTLVEAANVCAKQDGAEAVLFGGAPFASIAREIGERVAIPVLDGLTCAIMDAVAVPRSILKPSGSGTAPVKAMKNISRPLADLISASLDKR
jgi:Asp/Glu/hydantoin racemase